MFMTLSSQIEMRCCRGSIRVPQAHNVSDVTCQVSLFLQVLLMPCDSGYGFTVQSTQPITVGRVKVDSAAEKAGLHAGDVIAAVNQTRTLNMAAAEVASLVK